MVVLRPAMLGAGAHRDPVLPSYRGTTTGQRSSSAPDPLPHLPKYAPELHDIEAVWRDLKRHHLAHQTFTGPDDLDGAIQEAVITLNTERSRHPWANQQIAA